MVPEKASWLKADERVWLIDRLRRERPVREAHGKHTLWEALAHPRDQASTKGPPSAGGDQRGARPATTACGAPSDGLSSQLTHWWRKRIRTFGPSSQRSRSLSEGEWLKGRTGSLEKRSLIGDRGVKSLFFRQRVMVRIPFRAIGSRAKRTAPGWGRTGRLLVRSAWGNSDAVGEKGPVSERTVILAASEATLAGKEPSKVGSETTQIHRWRSALAETLLCLGGSVR